MFSQPTSYHNLVINSSVAPPPSTTENPNDCQDGNISSEAYLSAIIMGFVRLVASLLLSKLLRIYRRRSMYFVSALATTLSLFCFASCNFVVDNYPGETGPAVKTALNWASLATACALVFSVQLGVQVRML